MHYGDCGAFTDIIYLNLGNKKSNTRDFSLGNIGIPATTTADLQITLKSWIVTIAPEYRIVADPNWTVDLLAGARYAEISTTLSWAFTGSIGPLPPASRVGGSEASIHVWTGIGGIKGQYAFGADKRWSVPFYFDAGSGDSMRTYQVAGGVGYSFHWGEITALWRYLDYKPQSNTRLRKSISMDRSSAPRSAGRAWRSLVIGVRRGIVARTVCLRVFDWLGGKPCNESLRHGRLSHVPDEGQACRVRVREPAATG